MSLEKSLPRRASETSISYGIANFVAAFPASIFECMMLNVIHQEKPLSSNELIKRTFNMLPSYTKWQVISAVSGGVACLAYGAVKPWKNDPWKDIVAESASAAALETITTIKPEIESKMKGINAKDTSMWPLTKKMSGIIYLRNWWFWNGVVAAESLSKSYHLSPFYSGLASFAAGGVCSLLTMPLVNGLVYVAGEPERYKNVTEAIKAKFFENGGYGELRQKEVSFGGYKCEIPLIKNSGFAPLFKGVGYRFGVLAIYTVANNQLTEYLNPKCSDKIDRYKAEIIAFEPKNSDWTERLGNNYSKEIEL